MALLKESFTRDHAASSSACTDGSLLQQSSRVHAKAARFQKRRKSSNALTPKTFLKRKSFVTNSSLYSTLRRDSCVRRRFESFAARQFASEGVTFLESVINWQPGDFEEAKRIYETYIPVGAPLQVNISWRAREAVEKYFEHYDQEEEKENDNMPPNVFEPAVYEITNMMVEGGVWGTFVWKGGCDNAEIEPLVNNDSVIVQ